VEITAADDRKRRVDGRRRLPLKSGRSEDLTAAIFSDLCGIASGENPFSADFISHFLKSMRVGGGPRENIARTDRRTAAGAKLAPP